MNDEDLVKLSRKLTDEGKLVEAGWIGFRLMALDKDTPQIQRDAMRAAFFAGGHHLFCSIIGIIGNDDSYEPTEDDLRRMDLIYTELGEFIKNFKLTYPMAKAKS